MCRISRDYNSRADRVHTRDKRCICSYGLRTRRVMRQLAGSVRVCASAADVDLKRATFSLKLNRSLPAAPKSRALFLLKCPKKTTALVSIPADSGKRTGDYCRLACLFRSQTQSDTSPDHSDTKGLLWPAVYNSSIRGRVFSGTNPLDRSAIRPIDFERASR